MWPFTSSPAPNAQQDPQPSACPVDHSIRNRDGSTSSPRHRPFSGNDASDLPRDRVVSSIPRYRDEVPQPTVSTSSTPIAISPTDAQLSSSSSSPVASTSTSTGSTATCPVASSDSSSNNWVYPSPSQFYAALERKNKSPQARDMYSVVPIHNAVNERVWAQILEWENGYGQVAGAVGVPEDGKGKGPMLSTFVGKATERSPRAWMNVLAGYQPPFDRHDWEVYRPTTHSKIRYIIDFYPGRGASLTDHPISSSSASAPPNLSFYIDVRPALDGWEGARMRMARSWDDAKRSFAGTPRTSEQGQGQGSR